MFTRRETYADRTDTASDTASQMENAANSQSREPLEFIMLWRAGTEVMQARFMATASTRVAEMRRYGVSGDNMKWALKSRTRRGDWGRPIGTDEALKAELRKHR